MIHCTLNTGQIRISPRDEVAEHVIAALNPLLATGEHAMPGPPGYRCTVTTDNTALLATGWRDQVPLAIFGVAPDEDAAAMLWPSLDRHSRIFADLLRLRPAGIPSPQRPATAPWLAALILFARPDEAEWITDFERCLAWAWIDHRNAKTFDRGNGPDRSAIGARNPTGLRAAVVLP